ncbi:Oxygen-independent coproporphyrinogen-III oxidase [Serratia odorifera]|uniref:Oxygen-independent coproporphyrinogen III oxidase n=1 Tax=Serratia odorifera TaxID=618 RepID=A0A3S4HIN0_SEROD|nr:Oxygen-independent coproporphyrinogen-III oxidase [Serratia odorifera]
MSSKTLICNFQLAYQPIEQRYGIDFTDYFAEDLHLLAPFERDGLVERDALGIRVTPRGRLLIRNICMCFDVYLRKQARTQQFSRVI